jgi:DNA repair protein RadC
MQNLTIKSWAEDDRPREKLSLKGRHTLSNAELLAILLGSGTREKSAVELAQEILSLNNNSLVQLGKQNEHELKLTKGIGEAKAISIIAAMELARRRNDEQEAPIVRVTASSDVYNYMKPYLSDLYHEEFYVILLNRANKIIACENISRGGVSGTVVDGKIVFKKALDYKASGIILIHNHPSGALTPSEQDERLTKKLIDFGKFIEMPILDHVIFTDNGYFSFSDKGML